MKIPAGREDIANMFYGCLKNGRLGQTYIINGDSGMGKKTVADFILALIMCESHSACGNCPGCKSHKSGTHPDIILLKRADGRASIGVDSVRGIMGEIFVKPIMADYKAVVVHEAHLLTSEAQNAMLKVIEEPPERVVFFLLCDTLSTVLPTVVSRSVVINLKPLPEKILKDISGDKEAGFEISYSRGNPGRLKLIGDSSFSDLRDGTADAFLSVISDDDYEIFKAAAFFENHKENQNEIIDIILFFLRDVLYKKLGMEDCIVNKDKINIINAFGAKVGAKSCCNMMRTILNMQRDKGKNGNYNIAVTMMLLKCREEING